MLVTSEKRDSFTGWVKEANLNIFLRGFFIDLTARLDIYSQNVLRLKAILEDFSILFINVTVEASVPSNVSELGKISGKISSLWNDNTPPEQ